MAFANFDLPVKSLNIIFFLRTCELNTLFIESIIKLITSLIVSTLLRKCIQSISKYGKGKGTVFREPTLVVEKLLQLLNKKQRLIFDFQFIRFNL